MSNQRGKMTERRQKPIPVTSHEREFLEQQKKQYELISGDTGDWGKFLGTIVLLGLAAAGIYALAQATKRTTQSVDVRCSICGKTFVMAVPTGANKVTHVKCPYCQAELVVNLDISGIA